MIKKVMDKDPGYKTPLKAAELRELQLSIADRLYIQISNIYKLFKDLKAN